MKFKILHIISLLLIGISTETSGQTSFENIQCNTHKVSESVTAFDTSGFSIAFHLMNEQNMPLINIPITIEYTNVKVSHAKLINVTNTIQLKTNRIGYGSTNVIQGDTPITIYIGNKEQCLFKFNFEKEINGYGYHIYVKICDSNN